MFFGRLIILFFCIVGMVASIRRFQKEDIV